MMEWNSLRRIALPFIAACAALAACSASTTTNTTVLPATAIATLRFSPAGVRDVTFAGGKGIAITDFETGLNDYALATALQLDGSIVVAGASGKTQPSGAQLLIAVARYNSNGTPDAAFGTGGAVRTTIGTDHAEGDALALQADGKIVVAATIFSPTFSGKGIALLRYNGTDGTLDTGFNGTGIVTTTIGTGFDTAAAAVVVQSDQKIVVAGHANMTNGQTNTILLRYNTNGTPDATFGTNGLITTPLSDDSMALGMLLQPDGKIVVTGSLGAGSNPLDTIVLRYNSDGTLDSGFGSGGVARFDVGGNDFGNAVARQTADGNIVVTGHARVDFFSDTSDIAVLRIKGTDGTLDTSFGSGGTVIVNLGAFDNAFSVVLQTDGKIVVSGNSGSGSVTRAAVVRFNTDGTLDAGFGSGGIVTPVAAGPSLTASGNAVVFQPLDGSIYVTGYD